jgi:hypothetical protein
MAPEVVVLPLAFSTYFGVERPFYQLAHNLVLASPFGRTLRRYGTMAASHRHAEKALESGAAVLVFPGGDWEVHRPSWEGNRVDLAGRKGFIRLALNADVPIVPVVTIGGQETALFLSRGAWLAKLTGVDKRLRLKVLPISIALPWRTCDLLATSLPAKITIEVLPPINCGGVGPSRRRRGLPAPPGMTRAGWAAAERRPAPADAPARVDRDRRLAQSDSGLPARTRQRAQLHGRRQHGTLRATSASSARYRMLTRAAGPRRRPRRDRRAARAGHGVVVGHGVDQRGLAPMEIA